MKTEHGIMYSHRLNEESLVYTDPKEALEFVGVPLPATAYAWKRVMLPDVENLTEWILELVMAYLDVNYSASSDGPSDYDPEIEAAARNLASVIKANYVPFDCVRFPEGDVVVQAEEQP